MEGVTSAGSGPPVDPSQYNPPPSTHERGGKDHTSSTPSGGSQTQGADQTDKGDGAPKVNVHREDGNQDQGGQSGGGGSGSSSGGRGDSSSGGQSSGQGSSDSQSDTQTMLQDAHGKSNVQDGVLLNSSTGVQKTVQTSDVMTQATVNLSAPYTAPPPGTSPAQPVLSQPTNFDANAVSKEVQGNPWFSSDFLVSMVKSLTSYVSTQGLIQVEEMNIAIQNMKNTITQAQQTGDLELAVAKKQAQMYMSMAVASLVSLAVGLVGAGVGGFGKFKAAEADIALKGMKNAQSLKGEGTTGTLKTDEEIPNGNLNKGTGEGEGPPSAATEKNDLEGDAVAGAKAKDQNAARAKKLEVQEDNKKADSAQNREEGVQDGVRKDYEGELPGKETAKAQKNDDESMTRVELDESEGSTSDPDGVPLEGEPAVIGKDQDVALDKKAIGENGEDMGKGESGDPTSFGDQVKAKFKELSTKADSPKTKSPPEKEPTFENMQALRNKKKNYEALGSTGDGISMTNQSLNSMLDNFIQAIFTPQIGELQRAETLSQGRQKIIDTELGYAGQAFNNATSAITSAFQELQKIQDETARANDMKG